MQLTAYNVKTKEKNVPILNAVVERTAKGGYIAKGDDGKGRTTLFYAVMLTLQLKWKPVGNSRCCTLNCILKRIIPVSMIGKPGAPYRISSPY